VSRTSAPAPKRAVVKAKGHPLLRPVDPLTSLVLVFPVFLIYQAGVLVLPGVHNGADLVTSELLLLLHGRIALYIALNTALAVAFYGMLLYLRRTNTLDPGRFWSVLFESGIYALSMGSLIVLVMQDLLHVDPRLSVGHAAGAGGGGSPGLLAAIILSLGAGVHEELLFRLMMIPAVVWVCHGLLGLRRFIAVAIAFAVSAFLFSAAHHVVGGEPFRMGAFVYRVLCGLFFATLFQTRGFAVAVYTHALYDMYVLILHG
jgi:hypothetical protein